MTYEHDDSSGNRLRIEPSNIEHFVRFTVVDEIGLGKSTVHAARTIGNAAAAALEAAGITPSLTAALDCPEHYERRALAHLHTARKLRERKDAEAAAAQRERNKRKRITGGLEGVLSDQEAEAIPQDVMDRLAQWVADTYEKDQGETVPVISEKMHRRSLVEPDAAEVWSTASGYTLQKINDSWCLINAMGGITRKYAWHNITAHHFPLTRVIKSRPKQVLWHGEAAPEPTTVWTTTNGFTVEHDGSTWNLINQDGAVTYRYPTWESIPAVSFPMTGGVR